MIVIYVIVTPLHYKSVRRLSRPRRPVVPSLVGPVLFVDARLLSKDGAVSMSTHTYGPSQERSVLCPCLLAPHGAGRCSVLCLCHGGANKHKTMREPIEGMSLVRKGVA